MARSAPPIDGSVWLTGDRLTSDHVRGRVTIMVFWSAGCEASLVRLTQVDQLVRRLQQRHGTGTVAFVAVHSPRFPYAQDPEAAIEVLQRHRLSPIAVHDPNFVTWNRYHPDGWPATVVIGADGRVRGMQPGSADCAAVADLVTTEVDDIVTRSGLGRSDHRRRDDDPIPLPPVTVTSLDIGVPDDGLIDTGLSNTGLISTGLMNTGLMNTGLIDTAFPRSLDISTEGDLALVAGVPARCLIGRLDVASATVTITDVVGVDGEPTSVRWRSDRSLLIAAVDADPVDRQPHDDPQADTGSTGGAACHGGYVVEVPVDHRPGTGPVADRVQNRRILLSGMIRPLAMAEDQTGVLVADAGAEQLVRVSVGNETGSTVIRTSLAAGSGTTGNRDGLAPRARLAQPCALARGAGGWVFADAATSNIRTLSDRGRVTTLTDNGFFRWGLIDGTVSRARLQRPSDLCMLADGTVIIADTGNDRLRILRDHRIETLGLIGLKRPEAVTDAGGGLVLVADTAHHRLALVDVRRQEAEHVDILIDDGVFKSAEPIGLPNPTSLRSPTGDNLDGAAVSYVSSGLATEATSSSS